APARRGAAAADGGGAHPVTAAALALAGSLAAWSGYAAAGLVLDTFALLLLVRGGTVAPPAALPGRAERWLLAGATAAGAWLRLHDPEGFPPGIWLDEGRCGFWALRILRGETL